MRASSQVFIDVRSITSVPGNASSTSSKNGPEKLFSATLVTIVDTPNALAALATSAALLRSSTMLDRMRGERHLRLEVDQDERVVARAQQQLAGNGLGLRHGGLSLQVRCG